MYDLAVIGAGIVGLSHAWAAARAGKKVILFDRDQQAVGASIRNFGFVTITGQEQGLCWQRSMRSRRLWQKLAGEAGLEILHTGLTVVAREAESLDVMEAFVKTEMGERCELLTSTALVKHQPQLLERGLLGGLWSPHEIRVEAREVIAKITAYLAEKYSVDFHFSTAVFDVQGRKVMTSRGAFSAEQVVICSGSDISSLYPHVFEKASVTNTKLHMLRLAPQGSGWELNGAVMGDASLVRYLGFSVLQETMALKAALKQKKPWLEKNGIHLIIVQSADGSLVVGDSHHDALSPDPFISTEVEDHILDLARETVKLSNERVLERWIGTYPKQNQALWLVENPEKNVRIASITGGMGMSTAFAFGEDNISEIFGIDYA